MYALIHSVKNEQLAETRYITQVSIDTWLLFTGLPMGHISEALQCMFGSQPAIMKVKGFDRYLYSKVNIVYKYIKMLIADSNTDYPLQEIKLINFFVL